MHSLKTLILGITLAAVAGDLHSQDAAGAAQQVRKSAEKAAAQASAPANKPATQAAPKPAAQAPAKPAAPAPAKGSSAPSTQGKSAAPASPAAKPGTPAAQAAKPAKPPASKAAPGAKPSAGSKPQGKAQPAGARKTAPKKPAVKRAAKPSSAAERAQATLEKETRVARRDPFEAMIGRDTSSSMAKGVMLPQGKAGLQVSTLRLDGVVRAPNGMIAVVSNPQSRTYFLREGDQLYDGRVEKIAMDGVSFHEVGKDAFGKPVERQVNKRIYASAGEQQ